MSNHTLRSYLSGFIILGVGVVVPMTVPASAAVLAIFWCAIALAAVVWALTFQPIARHLPWRVVRNVRATDGRPDAQLIADAKLADECEQLADDIDAWAAAHGYDPDEPGLTHIAQGFSEAFDGRLFRCLEALVNGRYITREDLRRMGTGNTYMLSAVTSAKYVREWSHRLRRR